MFCHACQSLFAKTHFGVAIHFLAASVLFANVASAQVIIDYTYDDLNRLTNVARDDGPATEFTYDEVSNITMHDVSNSPNSDTDQVADFADNCTLVSNNDQRDADGDGFGNVCDPDLNNDGIVDFGDWGILKSLFGTTDEEADLNADGIVDFGDWSVMKLYLGQPPGPSGIQ